MMTVRSYISRVAVLLFAIIAYFYLPGIQEFFGDGITFLRNRDFQGLRQFILAYGMWAPVSSIMLMAIQSLVPFVPGLAITIMNALIFGWHYGALYSWVGALLGATLDFVIARWYGRPVVERFVNIKYLEKVDIFLKRHGILAIFLTRLTPIVPFKVVSYGAGLTNISFYKFVFVTGVGQAPAIILYSFLAQSLTHSIRLTIIIISILIVVGVFVYYYRDELERKFLNKE